MLGIKQGPLKSSWENRVISITDVARTEHPEGESQEISSPLKFLPDRLTT